MKRNWIGLLLLVVSVLIISSGCGSKGSSKSTGDPALAVMLSLINGGRSPDHQLEFDPAISNVAYNYAKFIGEASASYAPNLDGKTPQQRLTNAGISYLSAGETGAGPANASTAYSQMSSATLNDTKYTHVGIGAYLCSS